MSRALDCESSEASKIANGLKRRGLIMSDKPPGQSYNWYFLTPAGKAHVRVGLGLDEVEAVNLQPDVVSIPGKLRFLNSLLEGAFGGNSTVLGMIADYREALKDRSAEEEIA